MFLKNASTLLTRGFLRPVYHAIFRPFSSLSTKELIQDEAKFAAHNYHPLPVVFSKASGVHVWDPEGKKYIDFLSAYSAVNQGHGHPKIIAAMTNQVQNVSLSSRAFYNDQLPQFSKFLHEYFGYETFLPMNTGAEAVETALKIARKYAYEKKGVPKNEAIILSACGCFHGRTMHAITMSCDPEATEGFGPLVPGHVKVEFDNLVDLEAKLKANEGKVAAFIVEPIQGEAGVLVPQVGYLSKAKALCNKYGALFIADEVQTGIARTGKMLACDYDNVRPDLLILGKAISGGVYPVSAVLTDTEIMSVITPGTHGSTFGGNPVGCAVAKAALEVIRDEGMVEHAFKMGEIFRREMQTITGPDSLVEIVRGRGLLNAFVIKTKNVDKSAWDVCLLMKERGLLAKPTHGNIIRLAPPLVITQQELEYSISLIHGVLRDIQKMQRKDIPGAALEFKTPKPVFCKKCNKRLDH
jgi:ornithine--oxo-acid transaminase